MALPLALPDSRRCLLGLLEVSAHGNALSMTPWIGLARREERTQRAAWAAPGGPVEGWAARFRKFRFLMFFGCLLPMYSGFDPGLKSDSFDSTVGPFRSF